MLQTLIISNQTEFDSVKTSSSVLYETLVYSLTIPLFIITTAGNGVILITIKYQARLLSSTSNYFILSLALADFFVGIAIMPIMIVYTANRQKWAYHHVLCDIWMSFDFLCSSASFLTLSAMSIERYKMLTTSYVHIKHSSKLRVIIFICLSWLSPLVTWVPVIIIYRNINGITPGTCNNPTDKRLVLTLSVFIYHIPLICMVAFYTKLIIHIKKSSLNNLESNENFNLSYTKNLRNKKSIILNNQQFSNQNESINYYDRKYSVNLEQLRVQEPKIKRSNSINFNSYKPRFSPDVQYYNNNESYSSAILKKISTLFPCCCIKVKQTTTSYPTPVKSTRRPAQFQSPNLVKCIVEGNMNTFQLRNSLMSSPNRILNKKGALLYGQESDVLNSRKSSLNSRNDLNDSLNSSLTRFKIQNNSLNNFIEYQEMMINNRDVTSEITRDMTREKRFSLVSSKKNSLGVYENANYQNLRLKRNRKAARMLGLLVASFSICWLPYTIAYPLSQFFPYLVPERLNLIIWWMGYINSTINPFLYVYSNKNIRRSVRILFEKRLWNFFTGNKLNRNFRNDSMRHNILFGSYRNGNISHNNNNHHHHYNHKLDNKTKCKNHIFL